MNYGKSIKQAVIIRSCIDVRGLPKRNFVLARVECMVHWNSETGEVKTLEYNKSGSKIEFVSYDESWVYKKFMERSNVKMDWIEIR